MTCPMSSSDSSQLALEGAEAVPALHANADLCDYAHAPSPPPNPLSPPPLRSIADYHVYFMRMTQSCNWEYTLLNFDGNNRVHTNNYQGTSNWQHKYAQLIYPLAANKQFWARAWNACWEVWHTSAVYTHFYAMYVGAIPA